MTFLETLLSQVPENGVPVRRVVMGPFWTLVETDIGIGLAATRLADAPTHGQHGQQMPGAGHLTALSARELAENVMEPPSPARSIGLAALNAILPSPGGDCTDQNASELLRAFGKGKRIGIVGWFPFIPALQADGFDLDVFEKDPATGFAVTPARASRLGACDLLCITAATLVNGTLDAILEAVRPDAGKILVGPSAPLCRDLLDLGWDAVCGARVEQADPVLRIIQEGGCFRQIRHAAPPGAVRLLTLHR
jgi:hypothetical protein